MKTELHTTLLILLSIFLIPSMVKAKTEIKENYSSTSTFYPSTNCMSETVFGEPTIYFTLVDADTDTDISVMREGDIIDINTFANRNLNIRAEVLAGFSTNFTLTGPVNRTWTEHVPPYALFGDISGDYNGVKLPAGDYHLVANAYGVDDHINFSVGEDLYAITSFNLIRADDNLNFTDQPEYYINDGGVWDKNSYPFVVGVNPVEISINALTTSYAIGSVHLELSGPISYSRVENVAPFTLFGDSGGDYYGQILPEGNYTLHATPYTKANKQGEKGLALSIRFTIVDFANIWLDDGFMVNAETNVLFLYMNPYSFTTIDKKENPTDDVNIAVFQGSSSETVGSVHLILEGPVTLTKTENLEPFAIFGDIDSDYFGQSLPAGSYKLHATPYTGPNRTGKLGRTSIYNFEIIDTSSLSSSKTTLYPNPASSTTTLKTKDALTIYSGEVLDLSGTIVMKLPKNWTSNQPIDVSGLKKGLYIVQMNTGNEQITKKLIVQ